MGDHELDATRLRRLIGVGRSFVEELDPEALFDDILSAAQDLTGARYAALGVMDGNRERLARFLTRGVDAATRQEIGDLPHGRGILGVLIEEPEPLRLDDLHAHPRSYGFPAGHPPMTSFLGVPVVVRGKAWGNLYLTEKADGPFDAADEEALVTLADWAAVAVNNSRIYAEVHERHREATRSNHALAATNAIARAIGTETDLDRVLELIVKRGRALIDARTVMFSLPRGHDLEIVAVAGDSGHARPGMRVPLAGTTAGKVLNDQRPRRMPADQLGLPPATLGIHGASSTLLVPLVFHGRSLGVLLALDPVDGRPGFDAEDEDLMLAFAASAAMAVATAQTVSDQRLRDVLASAEQERRRWARELHDETLQGLAALRVRLAVAEQNSRAPETSAAVHDVLEALGSEIRKLRTLITELRPAALDELGLEPALDSIVQQIVATTGLQIDLHVDLGEQRLDAELETTVFRLVQESLTNVTKHAHATRCAITVTEDGHDIDVAIRDDGCGIDEAALAKRDGFGLTGMRERAQLTGGTLDLNENAHGGTDVRARLPLRRFPASD